MEDYSEKVMPLLSVNAIIVGPVVIDKVEQNGIVRQRAALIRHYKIFCVNVKYRIQYGFRIFYLIALQNEENYEREESCSA